MHISLNDEYIHVNFVHQSGLGGYRESLMTGRFIPHVHLRLTLHAPQEPTM